MSGRQGLGIQLLLSAKIRLLEFRGMPICQSNIVPHFPNSAGTGKGSYVVSERIPMESRLLSASPLARPCKDLLSETWLAQLPLAWNSGLLSVSSCAYCLDLPSSAAKRLEPIHRMVECQRTGLDLTS